MPEEKRSGLHQNHRSRMRERFLKEGTESFADHELLEMLLYSAIPRKDTNEVAHMLLMEFGSLSKVMGADVWALSRVKGMTENAAVLIKFIAPFYRRVLEDEVKSRKVLNNSQVIGEFLLPRFVGRSVETVFALYMDAACKLLRCEVVSEGSFTNVPLDLRKIAETSFKYNAVNLVLAHNHPYGTTKPSQKDIFVTEQANAVLGKLSIHLLDHFVIAGGRYLSMMEQGLLGVQKATNISL